MLEAARNVRSTLLYKAASSSKSDDWQKARQFAAAHADYCQVFESDKLKTIFTSEYRLSALDLNDVRIAEGHQIALRVIKRMNESATSGNIQYIVALIPTKELVFRIQYHTR